MSMLAALKVLENTNFTRIAKSKQYQILFQREYTLAWKRLVDGLFQQNRQRHTCLPQADFRNLQNLYSHYQNIQHDLHSQPGSLIQFNFREALQSVGVSRLPAVRDFCQLVDLLPRGSWVELNGLNQVDAEGSYTLDLVRACLVRGLQPTLHAGASSALVVPTLDFIKNHNLQNEIILKVYARVEKYDLNELRQILNQAREIGLPSSNIRVGVEHLSSLLYSGLVDSQERGEDAREVLGIVRELLRLLKEFGVTRLSGPETRGIADDPQAVYAMMRTLLGFIQDEGFGLDSFEIHCHNDLGQADANTLAVLSAVTDHNEAGGTKVLAIADTSLGYGERNGIADRGFLSQLLSAPEADELISQAERTLSLSTNQVGEESLLRAYTAGTHLNLLWNKVQEFVEIVTSTKPAGVGEWLENVWMARPDYKPYQNLLDDKRFLITCLSLHLYGEALPIREDVEDFTPFLPLNNPTLGRLNVVFRLLLEGFDLSGQNSSEKKRIVSFLRQNTNLGDIIQESWLDEPLDVWTKKFMVAVKTQSRPIDRHI